MNFLKTLNERILFLDGAMGTMLQKKGLLAGECPETWNYEKQDKLIEVHKEYINAGSDIINTNTFGGNSYKLEEYDLQDKLEFINQKGVEAALKARDELKKDIFIAASIGPTGQFLAPMGEVSFEKMFEVYYTQVKALANAGADLINFETMVDIAELRIAVLAAKEACNLPVLGSLTFTESGRTLTGSDILSGFNILEGINVDVLGMNCGMGPSDMAGILKGVNEYISKPIVVQANAGIPQLIDGKTCFTCSVPQYIKELELMVTEGVNIVGGCCGTTPEFIKEVANHFKNSSPKKINALKNNSIKISSPSQTVLIGKDQLFCRIGEKINPSALKKVANDIKTKSCSGIKEVAKDQEKAGAHILDINMGLGGSNEAESFKRVIPELLATTRLPFCIDTTDATAMEEALKIYPGRALINSISGEAERIEAVLPLMAKYGSYAILLPLNEEGIPNNVEKRLEIIENILKIAKNDFNISSDRFLIDALIMTVSAAPDFAQCSLDTVKAVYEKLGLFSTCGLSNISFGLPGRNAINSAFLSMLIGYGMDSAILNPQDDLLNICIDASDVLTKRDLNAGNFVKKHKAVKNFFKGNNNSTATSSESTSSPESTQNTPKKNESNEDKTYNAVIDGEKEKISTLLEDLIKKYKAQEILNKFMIPAITKVGELYDQKVYFLPQLMLSAETMKTGMQFLEPYLKQEVSEHKAIIVIATVKGDIHDIGKNIVSIILENYGFKVHDIGKDVSKEVILEKALEYNADIICLSALMTTTMVEMEHFITYMKENDKDIPVMVGGAVVNNDYAEKIGAYYSSDAVDAVEVANKIINSKSL